MADAPTDDALHAAYDATYNTVRTFDRHVRALRSVVATFAPRPPAAPLTPPGLDIRFHLVADQMPELIEHSTSYGGRWSSKWCICLKPDGTAEVNRWTVTDEVKGALDQGRKPFAPWTTSRTANPFFTPYLAWAYVDDVAALLAPITTHKDAP